MCPLLPRRPTDGEGGQDETGVAGDDEGRKLKGDIPRKTIESKTVARFRCEMAARVWASRRSRGIALG